MDVLLPLLFFFLFLLFFLRQFEGKQVHTHGQTLDGILLILWCAQTVCLMNCKNKIK